jgi:large subunit ribosomal protein L22
MEAIAKTRHLKGSPRKARLVIDLIRGRNVSQALNILKFTDKRAADPIAKTLRSAIANATYQAEQQNIAIDPDDLYVKTCFVDMGAHKNRRRMRPAPQGRAYREQRHYCHITILVSSDKPEVKEEKPIKKAKVKAEETGDKKAAKTTEKKAKSKKAVEELETPVTETATEEVENPKAAKAKKTEAEEVKSEAETVEASADTAAEETETKPADGTQVEEKEENEK